MRSDWSAEAAGGVIYCDAARSTPRSSQEGGGGAGKRPDPAVAAAAQAQVPLAGRPALGGGAQRAARCCCWDGGASAVNGWLNEATSHWLARGRRWARCRRPRCGSGTGWPGNQLPALRTGVGWGALPEECLLPPRPGVKVEKGGSVAKCRVQPSCTYCFYCGGFKWRVRVRGRIF